MMKLAVSCIIGTPTSTPKCTCTRGEIIDTKHLSHNFIYTVLEMISDVCATNITTLVSLHLLQAFVCTAYTNICDCQQTHILTSKWCNRTRRSVHGTKWSDSTRTIPSVAIYGDEPSKRWCLMTHDDQLLSSDTYLSINGWIERRVHCTLVLNLSPVAI